MQIQFFFKKKVENILMAIIYERISNLLPCQQLENRSLADILLQIREHSLDDDGAF